MVGGPIVAAVMFDWTISLGSIVNAVMLIIGAYAAGVKLYHALDKRIDRFELEISAHAKTLEDHASRMERWESTLFKVVSDLQRVIGRMEVPPDRRWDGTNRRDVDRMG